METRGDRSQADKHGVFTYEQVVMPYPPGAGAWPARPPVDVPDLEPEPCSVAR